MFPSRKKSEMHLSIRISISPHFFRRISPAPFSSVPIYEFANITFYGFPNEPQKRNPNIYHRILPTDFGMYISGWMFGQATLTTCPTLHGRISRYESRNKDTNQLSRDRTGLAVGDNIEWSLHQCNNGKKNVERIFDKIERTWMVKWQWLKQRVF